MSTNPTTIDAPAGLPVIEITREFDAPPELVFRAWADPDLVVQWLGPRRVEMRIVDWDTRTGGGYSYIHRTPDGTEHAFRGVFHTVSEPALIVQTFEYAAVPDEVSLEWIRFDDADGRTRVRQRAVFPSIETRDQAIASGMESGIVESMERLDEVLSS
jgi:uncharacterized protein YndB with AHSA1/START domain